MPTKEYQIVVGVIVAIIVLILAGLFIFILVTYSNKRKRKFIQEREELQRRFHEQLLQSQLEMQEQTFSSISQEIHDNVGQILSLAKVQINILAHGKFFNEDLIFQIRDSIGKAMTDLRDVAKSLNSDRIKIFNLVEMTNYELQRIERLGIIKTRFDVNGTEKDIPDQKKLIIMRIIQESLHNILKHSEATTIVVSFQYNPDSFNCEISDDGIGFDQEKVGKKDGLGIRNIVNRATLIGGEGHITSEVNKGTTVSIHLPGS